MKFLYFVTLHLELEVKSLDIFILMVSNLIPQKLNILDEKRTAVLYVYL